VATPGKPDSFGGELRRCIEELPRAHHVEETT